MPGSLLDSTRDVDDCDTTVLAAVGIRAPPLSSLSTWRDSALRGLPYPSAIGTSPLNQGSGFDLTRCIAGSAYPHPRRRGTPCGQGCRGRPAVRLARFPVGPFAIKGEGWHNFPPKGEALQGAGKVSVQKGKVVVSVSARGL